ncbi:MAG: TonB-dependent receptor [Holophagaceae bacterium]|nr:TonB-dependent receptor [Holophagaceae bacterium]
MPTKLTKWATFLVAAVAFPLVGNTPTGQIEQAGQVAGQEDKEKKKEPILGQITVVITAEKEVLEHVHTRVNAEMIEAMNATNLSEALAFLPGLSFSTGSRGDLSAYVRGHDPRRVPVFLDGIPNYVPYRGEMDFARFSTFDLAEIQVSKGFGSILYGPNAMGGAINLVTRKPEEKFEGNAMLGATDGDGKRVSVNVGSNHDRFYIQAGGSLRDHGDFVMSSKFTPTDRQDASRRNNSDYKDTKMSTKIGFMPSANSEYVIGYMRQSGEKGTPVATQGSSARYWRWPTWDKDNIYFISNTELGAKSYIKLRAYHDTYKNALEIYTDNTYSQLNGDPSRYDDFTNGALLEFGTTALKGHSIRAVAQVKRDVHRGDSSNRGVGWKIYKDELSSFGLEDSVTINQKLDMNFGLALDRQSPLDTGEYPTKSVQTFLQGQFGIFWKTTDTVQTYITVARKNRFPTISDRFSLRFDRYIENPDLKPEESLHFDIGAKAKLSHWLALEGAIFYSDLTNLIQEVQNVQDGLSQMQNIDKAKHQGIELSMNIKPFSWWETGIYYTYLHHENLRNSDVKLTRVPRNRITGFTKIKPIAQFYAMASVESQNGMWENDTTRLGGYSVANLTLGYAPTKALALDAGYTNILDRNYQQSFGYPMAGRTWFINGRYKF